MRAVRISRFGGPEVMSIEDIPAPVPASGQLLLRVRAAGVNPVDFKIRQGGYPMVKEQDLPLTLGRDACGVVAATSGNSGGFREGDKVFALLPQGSGAYAELAIAGVGDVAVMPGRLSETDAGAVPLAAMTAWQGLFDHGRLQQGQRVLIHAGAGGVGHFAVQFAKQRGAEVITTVGTDDLAFAHELGADRAIDYTAGPFEDGVTNVDLVFDLIGGETQTRSFAVLKPGGTMISTLQEPDPAECERRGVTGGRFLVQPNGAQLSDIGRMLDEAHVRVVVSEVFPLERVRAAHERLQAGGTRGKLVLRVVE